MKGKGTIGARINNKKYLLPSKRKHNPRCIDCGVYTRQKGLRCSKCANIFSAKMQKIRKRNKEKNE